MVKVSRRFLPMYYFHTTPDRSDYLKFYPNQLRILSSAYRRKKFPRVRDHLSLAKEVFIDSGMISAWKKKEAWWQHQQPYVIDYANEVDADYCAMLDLPMEPGMLKKNGVHPDDALARTIKNAEAFVDAKVSATKVFVVQGYTLSQYKRCIEAYRTLGIFEMTDNWVGIGSVCMRSPKKGLYDVCRFVRQHIPNHHLHAFGIGRKEWIWNLKGFGVDSFDSSSASMAVAFNRGVTRVEGKRNDAQVVRQFADEMMAYESHLSTPTT